jgi:hypothetical protein
MDVLKLIKRSLAEYRKRKSFHRKAEFWDNFLIVAGFVWVMLMWAEVFPWPKDWGWWLWLQNYWYSFSG